LIQHFTIIFIFTIEQLVIV